MEESRPESQNLGANDASSIGLKLLLWMALYFALHVITRVLLSKNLQLDEAEQLIVTQDWRMGYGSQPPLYNWLQKALFSILGVNVLSLSLLKNTMLWSTYAFCYLAAREILNNARLAALATASLLFFPQIAWESQRDQSHLVLATAIASATLFIFVRLLKTQRIHWYILLGAAIALGFLAKYNYLILIAGLLCAAWTLPTFRRATLTWRMLVALAVFFLVIAPHLIWMFENKAAVASQSYKFTISGKLASLPLIVGPIQMLMAFVGITVVPLLVFTPLVRAEWKFKLRPEIDPLVRLLLRAFIFGVTLSLLATLCFRVTYIRDRWLQPLFFALPILLVGILAPRLQPRHFKRLFGLAAFVAVFVLAAVNGTALFANILHRAHNLNVPYPALAAALRHAGFTNGDIIASGFLIGGNLKAQFPNTRVTVPELEEKRVPQRPTLIVWSARSDDLPEDFLTYAAAAAHVSRANLQPQFVEAPCENGPRKSEKLGFVLLR